VKKRFEEYSRVCRPLLIVLKLKVFATRASSVDFFKHRRKCAFTWRKSPERRNYSLSLILKCIDLEGLMVEAVNEIFVDPV
jgi:hypothetical protein